MSDLEIKKVSYLQETSAIKYIRTKVFQEEQKISSSLEFDGLDETAIHLLAYVKNNPVGTARIRKITEHEAKIERLAVIKEFRKQKIGKKLMEAALKILAIDHYEIVVVHAQEYIKNLYVQLGFEQIGATFAEAGIAHVKMIKYLK